MISASLVQVIAMTKTRRTESETVRREQILNAARKVLDTKCYDATTVSDIVKEAGVAQGTFYLYFESKKDAVMELGRQVMGEMTRRLTAAQRSDATFEEQLRLVLRTGFQVADQNADLCRLMHVGEESAGRKIKQAVGVAENPFMLSMVAMFRSAIERGETFMCDPEVAVRLLHRMVGGALQEAHLYGDKEDTKCIAETMEELVVRAFVKR